MKIKTNSKEVVKSDTFYAIKGLTTNGHDYVEEAIKNGASTIYVEEGIYSKDVIYVEDTKRKLSNDLYNQYSYIFNKLKLIGITGTNGKTTTAYMMYETLNKLNKKTSYIGTIGFHLDGVVTNLDNTTPDILTIYKLLLASYEAGVEYVCMEVSSHALKLGRVANLEFDFAIYSNITSDHLDFHNTIDDYVSSKQLLFKQVKKDGICIINKDDNYYEHMLLSSNNNITYGTNLASDYVIDKYSIKDNKTTFNLDNTMYSTNVLGKYNVYNITCLIILLELLKVDKSNIGLLVNSLNTPKGRMDSITYKDNLIIVDYAHTYDAVKKMLNTVKEFAKGKIYSIIGCGGNRDKTKRFPMALVSTNLSDYVIFTNDNPRFEDEKDIINDMTNNLTNYNYEIEYNRKEAIHKGIDLLDKNDILVILGKGHEDYQIIKDKRYYHDDKKEVEEYIKRKK